MLDVVITTQVLNICCSSLYGSLVWNLNHVCIAEVYVTWRKGVRRVWSLPADTHSELFTVVCDSIPFLHVVFCRTTNFINCCLNSSSEIENYVARHGVFVSRMRSPVLLNLFGSGHISVI